MSRRPLNAPMPDSPVDIALRAGPRGKGDWPGFDSVYTRIAAGCQNMASKVPGARPSDDHVESMADLGSGHEERMKARLHWMIDRGYITGANISGNH